MKIIVTAAIAAMAIVLNFSYPPSSIAGKVSIAALPVFSIDDLLDAIEQVESNGNPNAIGDDGNAIGSFQIWESYVDDVNRILGKKKYSYQDRLDSCLSRQMTKTYISHYAIEKRLHHKPTHQDMARIHNGGPNGYRKKSTEIYWGKIKKELLR